MFSLSRELRIDEEILNMRQRFSLVRAFVLSFAFLCAENSIVKMIMEWDLSGFG